MLVFDKKRKRCVSPPTEDCEVPATTPAPEEDSEGGPLPSGGRGGRPQSLPENRRRFQNLEGAVSPDQRGPPDTRGLPPGALPFDISNSGATLLSRPPQ